MSEITTETTLGSLAARFADMVIESSAKEYVKHASLPDNLIKGEIFNLPDGIGVKIVLKAIINGEEFSAEDFYTPGIINDKEAFDISKNTDNQHIYITREVMNKLFIKVKERIIKTATK